MQEQICKLAHTSPLTIVYCAGTEKILIIEFISGQYTASQLQDDFGPVRTHPVTIICITYSYASTNSLAQNPQCVAQH